MQDYSISKSLGLKGIRAKSVSHSEQTVELYLITPKKILTCPSCGCTTSKVHDYRNQTIKDLPISGKHTLLILKKRRYTCCCGKRFYELYSFLPKYQRKSNRLVT